MKLSYEDKQQLVQQMAERINESNVVGILDMHSLPARQLQQIKKELKDDADLVMSRKTLMYLALEQSDKKNIQDLKDNTAIQPAFIFSDSNPFTLYKIIKNKKSSAPASGGEIAPDDIVLEEGDTGIGPGPMIGHLQSLGAQTSVEDGTISITQEGVAVEEGEVITPDVAEILNKLGLEPLEVGLDLKLVHEDGEVFDKNVLDIDEDEYRQDFESAASRGFNLAVNAGYLTGVTAQPILVERFKKVRNLVVNEGIPVPEYIEDILSKAGSEARSLDAELDLESVEIKEENDNAEASEESQEENTESDEEDNDTADEAEDESSTDEGSDEEESNNDEPSDDNAEASEESSDDEDKQD
jgi:large subunit ribosomal protein L10